MALTNYPNGVSSFGVPAIDMALLRAAARNAKVRWLDPRNSGGGNGNTPTNAFTTMTAAYAACGDESGDVVLWPATDGGTGSSSRDTANIAWSKSGITVVGGAAPVPFSQRARVAPTTTFADPLLTISGNNNAFYNMQFFQGHDAASTCLSVTGDRNYFYNCHIAGIGHATAGDDAASESLLLDGCEENLFENCTIGLNTIARSAACAEIRTANQATRNRFVNCTILAFADAAGALWVDIPSGGLDRSLEFIDCRFFNAIDSTATTMTVGMAINASAGGTVILDDCFRYGATDWADNFGNIAQLGRNSGTAATDMGAGINGS